MYSYYGMEAKLINPTVIIITIIQIRLLHIPPLESCMLINRKIKLTRSFHPVSTNCKLSTSAFN